MYIGKKQARSWGGCGASLFRKTRKDHDHAEFVSIIQNEVKENPCPGGASCCGIIVAAAKTCFMVIRKNYSRPPGICAKFQQSRSELLITLKLHRWETRLA